MARRRVIWHIGPADPGTDFLASALQAARPALAEHGIAVPSGPWHEIENQIWKHKGTSLLSTPGISRADRAKVSLRLNGLRDLEVHLVVLVRDLPTQVYAGWQAGLQHGSTTSLKKYAARVLDPERGHWQAEEFWHGHDLGRILPLWTRAMHADRVHVVTAPADADGIWERLLDVAGVPAITRPDGFVPVSLSADLAPERVLDITTEWAKLIADKGFDMRGSLITAAAAAPAAADRGEQLEAVAELLTATTAEVERLRAEVGRLREENARLDRKRRKHKQRVAELSDAG
jgi:hypothetical protein